MATNNGKFAPEHKKSGDLILSAEWNAGMQETVRLESAKVNRQGGDSLQGPLTIESALAVSTDTLSVQLEVRGALKLAKGVAVNEFSNDDSLSADSDRIVPTQKAVKFYVDTVKTSVDTELTQLSTDISTTLDIVVQGDHLRDFKAKDMHIFGELKVEGDLKFKEGVAVNQFSIDSSLSNNSDSIVPTQKAVKAYVDTAVTTLNTQAQGVVVTGMIVMWSGQSNQIPKGWAMCNGQNGTPDLRERFILGAYETESRQTPKSMDSGGPDQHSHSIASRSLSTSMDGVHRHVWRSSRWSSSHQNVSIHSNTQGQGNIQLGTDLINNDGHVTSDAGSHTHTVNFNEITTANSTGNNRPKWYALCFIIKL